MKGISFQKFIHKYDQILMEHLTNKTDFYCQLISFIVHMQQIAYIRASLGVGDNQPCDSGGQKKYDKCGANGQ